MSKVVGYEIDELVSGSFRVFAVVKDGLWPFSTKHVSWRGEHKTLREAESHVRALAAHDAGGLRKRIMRYDRMGEEKLPLFPAYPEVTPAKVLAASRPCPNCRWEMPQ